MILGDCKLILPTFAENSLDCCITDPPYGLTDEKSGFHRGKPNQFTRTAKGGFMGKAWDGSGIQYDIDFWHEVLRVLKPGAYLLAFGGSRTYHRLACAIEDAGFEIRDMIEWLYGSGFPKALDVSKAIDKMMGVYVKGEILSSSRETNGNMDFQMREKTASNPQTPEAKYWEGWKSALKPAHEPICVARKPLDGTIAENCLKWGVGAMNIDGSRIKTNENLAIERNGDKKLDTQNQGWGFKAVSRGNQGRYPANVILDEEAGRLLDEQSGVSKSSPVGFKGVAWKHSGNTREKITELRYQNEFNDSGGASRFFYCAKSSRNERNAGLEGMEEKESKVTNFLEIPRDNGTIRNIPVRQNHHPTVKPIKLMEYLINLVSREGQTVLDPFVGSGTTGIACGNLNREFIGIEKEKEYFDIAQKRIEYWANQKKEEILNNPTLFEAIRDPA